MTPVRADIAARPEMSDFTSIQLCIKAPVKGEQPKALLPFTDNEHQHKAMGIRFSLRDYLTLVDETGRVLRDDKRGAINATSANILARLHISDDSWLKLISDFEGIFTGALGTAEHLCE